MEEALLRRIGNPRVVSGNPSAAYFLLDTDGTTKRLTLVADLFGKPLGLDGQSCRPCMV
jgi:hypothetical protein